MYESIRGGRSKRRTMVAVQSKDVEVPVTSRQDVQFLVFLK